MRFPSAMMPQLWLDGLRMTSSPGKAAFKDWLGSDSGYAVTALPSSSAVDILVHSEPEFLRPLAFEVNLWASSAFETISSISPNAVRSNAIAWPLIQLYYSAFFSAHSILRAFGYICTQLDRNHADALRRSARATGISGDLGEGFYVFRYDRSLMSLHGTKVRDSHADTWRTFNSLVTSLSSRVLTIAAANSDKIAASVCLTKLNEVLENRGAATGGNWLSQFRNRVNYQKAFGVWYPYLKANPSIDELLHSLGRWRETSSDFTFDTAIGDVPRFIEASVFITSFCRSLILEFSRTRSSRQHFVDRGGLDFLRFAKCYE